MFQWFDPFREYGSKDVFEWLYLAEECGFAARPLSCHTTYPS